MRLLLAALILPVLLAGCATVNKDKLAPPDQVQAALFRDGGQPSLTLYTVVSRGGTGGHTALLINADHRALFDPAGSWYNDAAPQRHDMHYGMNAQLVDVFENHHARPTHDVIIQTIPVSADVAARAMRLAEAQGAVAESNCTRATSAVLSQLPGFEGVGRTWFPNTLSERVAKLPDVATSRRSDDEWQPHEIALGAHLRHTR